MPVVPWNAFGRGELTNSSKWYTRVWKPISDALQAIWGPDNSWHALTLASGWTAVSTGTNGVPAWRVRDGVLYLRGVVSGSGVGTLPSTITTLPTQARPALPIQSTKKLIFTATSGLGGRSVCRINYLVDVGTVQIEQLAVNANLSGVYLGNIVVPLT